MRPACTAVLPRLAAPLSRPASPPSSGRTTEALALYGEALSAWRELRIAWDEALTGHDMAKLLDPSLPEVRRAAKTAREFLTRVRAKPFLEQLDAALSRPPPAASVPSAAATKRTSVASEAAL